MRRRQIQLQSSGSVQVPEMVQRILAREGIPGFYRGFLPNALKNLPNKGVRHGIYPNLEVRQCPLRGLARWVDSG